MKGRREGEYVSFLETFRGFLNYYQRCCIFETAYLRMFDFDSPILFNNVVVRNSGNFVQVVVSVNDLYRTTSFCLNNLRHSNACQVLNLVPRGFSLECCMALIIIVLEMKQYFNFTLQYLAKVLTTSVITLRK